MYRYIAFVLLLLNYSLAWSQKWEAGFGTGISHYKGDLRPSFRVFQVNPGANILIRYNHNDALSLKATLLGTRLSAKDRNFHAPLNLARDNSFSTLIWEAAGQLEYNFENFRESRIGSKTDWSPYLFAGYGTYQILNRHTLQKSGGSNFLSPEVTPSLNRNYCIPFGIGFKKRSKGNWNWGCEFGARKTYSDEEIDSFGYLRSGEPNLNSSATNPGDFLLKKYTIPNTREKDMYFYTNIWISYVFYRVNCPNPKR